MFRLFAFCPETVFLPFVFDPQASATCLAHLRAADECEAEAAAEDDAENVAPAAIAPATKRGSVGTAAAGKSVGAAKKSGAAAEASAAAVPVRPVAGCPHELTPEAYNDLAESVRGKVPFAAAVACYAAVAAACLAKNAKLMKGAMPDPVRSFVRWFIIQCVCLLVGWLNFYLS
jgi:hypothetical protein